MVFNPISIMSIILMAVLFSGVFLSQRKNSRLFGIFFFFLLGMASLLGESTSCPHIVEQSQSSLSTIHNIAESDLTKSLFEQFGRGSEQMGQGLRKFQSAWDSGLPSLLNEYCYNVHRWSICLFVLPSICWLFYCLQGKLEAVCSKLNLEFDDSQHKEKEYFKFTGGEWALLGISLLFLVLVVCLTIQGH